ncbi:helix-turn-helix domain-containing protein [Mucilaginibacter sp. Bleaf8]|uniref:helix-turn-helix domain-containing protein n=1 Tax=Mucilaginibacter sp. Bleaf8 TaxID=2834430 RepID=UPI001BD1B407|nr:AraC family transcriptional regulator [Mucilaginibacter sp. Bleaf8]MBS7563309.1 helix-turn-helix domain-containing protein [Mucilaginibacter sp. Bleaf8]
MKEESLKLIDKHPDSVYVLHEKVERKFSVHSHKKGQLTYVQGGITYVHMEEKTYVIPSRHYIWIPSNLKHWLQVGHSATAIRNLYFYSMDDESNPFYTRMGIYPVNTLLYEMIVFTEQWNGDIKPNDKAFAFVAAIKNILPLLGDKNLPIVLPTTTNERIRPVLLYLRDHAALPLSLQSVSEKFGFSERTLSRLFQSTLSISFLQYLKQLRMVKAVEMMLQSDMTLSQIAFATGYNSLSAFSNTFYQLTQMRPSEFEQAVIASPKPRPVK